MVSKLYDGSNWKNINGLKLYNGSAWKNAVRGWMWNGSAWKQWYPEYPINTAAPTVSGTATQGNTLSCTTGSWNSNLAYSPASYSYQWRRGSSDISGATSSTYSTVVADVGNAISCRVTATNNRGSTPVISSNSITVTSAAVTNVTAPTTGGSTFLGGTATVTTGTWNGNPNSYSYQWYNASNGTAISGATSSSLTIPASVVGASVWCLVTATNTSTGSSASAYSSSFIALPTVTGLSVSDSTITPGAPSSVSVTVTGQTTANVSWGAGTNISFYDGYSSVGTLTNRNDSARTANVVSGTAGTSFTVFIRSANFNGRVTGSWNAISGSHTTVTYYIYVDGNFITTTTSNSYTYTKGNTSGSTSFQVVAYVGGSQGSSQSGSVSLTTKYSGYTSGSGTFQSAAIAPSTPTSGGGTYSSGVNYVTNATFISSSSGTTPITYSWTVYSSDFNTGPWSFRNSGSLSSSSLSTTLNIPQQGWDADSFGTWAQYNVTASNSAGSSGTLTWVI